jgi:hypothetical protein
MLLPREHSLVFDHHADGRDGADLTDPKQFDHSSGRSAGTAECGYDNIGIQGYAHAIHDIAVSATG